MAAGLKAQFGSPMKPVNAGQAAANGVEAAQLARAGMTGSAEVFDAVLKMQAGEGNVHAFDDLGTTWMFDTVSHNADASFASVWHIVPPTAVWMIENPFDLASR